VFRAPPRLARIALDFIGLPAMKGTNFNERLRVTAPLRRRLSWCAAVLIALASAPSIAQTDLQLNLTREVLEASGARAALQRVPALVGSSEVRSAVAAGRKLTSPSG
jgi:hypothetical protein